MQETWNRDSERRGIHGGQDKSEWTVSYVAQKLAHAGAGSSARRAASGSQERRNMGQVSQMKVP